jgi:hypothetical protein
MSDPRSDFHSFIERITSREGWQDALKDSIARSMYQLPPGKSILADSVTYGMGVTRNGERIAPRDLQYRGYSVAPYWVDRGMELKVDHMFASTMKPMLILPTSIDLAPTRRKPAGRRRMILDERLWRECKKRGVPFPKPRKSAYEVALEHGFRGTKNEWLQSLL